jgi:hypothetical protein
MNVLRFALLVAQPAALPQHLALRRRDLGDIAVSHYLS